MKSKVTGSKAKGSGPLGTMAKQSHPVAKKATSGPKAPMPRNVRGK